MPKNMMGSGEMMANSAESEEPTDNLVTFNPSDPDFEALAAFEDGAEVTGQATLRIISPGKAEITEFTPDESVAEEESTETEEAPAQKPAQKSGSSNPAIDSLTEE